MSDIKPTFAGEMQLAGWSETHTGGCKVTFWLQDSADLDAFRALTVRKGNTAGHRFMAALVEIGDDEQPAQEPVKAEKPKGGELAKLAGMWCDSPEFRTWLKRRYPMLWGAQEKDGVPIADVAAAVVRAQCGVTSRADLDNNDYAAMRFQEFIRLPYKAHLEAGTNRERATA